jgi:hypothetical protein
MVSMLVQWPRLPSSNVEWLSRVRSCLDELLPYCGETIASVADRNPTVLGGFLMSNVKTLLRLAYYAYIHELADQGLAAKPAPLAANTLVRKPQAWMARRFPGFADWVAEKSLSDGMAALASVRKSHPTTPRATAPEALPSLRQSHVDCSEACPHAPGQASEQ